MIHIPKDSRLYKGIGDLLWEKHTEDFSVQITKESAVGVSLELIDHNFALQQPWKIKFEGSDGASATVESSGDVTWKDR